jgi:hypothetical protein
VNTKGGYQAEDEVLKGSIEPPSIGNAEVKIEHTLVTMRTYQCNKCGFKREVPVSSAYNNEIAGFHINIPGSDPKDFCIKCLYEAFVHLGLGVMVPR